MKENEFINQNGDLVIFNGGNPLPGSPESWEEAHRWEESANEEKDGLHEPHWKFDCGFKLDFDGPLLDISSRFYPPANYYGPKWDGKVHVLLLGEEIHEKSFEADTLEELRGQVEEYVKELAKDPSALLREGKDGKKDG